MKLGPWWHTDPLEFKTVFHKNVLFSICPCPSSLVTTESVWSLWTEYTERERWQLATCKNLELHRKDRSLLDLLWSCCVKQPRKTLAQENTNDCLQVCQSCAQARPNSKPLFESWTSLSRVIARWPAGAQTWTQTGSLLPASCNIIISTRTTEYTVQSLSFFSGLLTLPKLSHTVSDFKGSFPRLVLKTKDHPLQA